MIGWIVFLAVAVPLVVFFAWMILDGALVQIPSGRLGLLLVKGRATDKVLDPGPHWVPALRKRMVEEYPSVEMVYRAVPGAGVPAGPSGDLVVTGPAPEVTLGDRTAVTLGYTVRFRLDETRLRAVHEKIGPGGLWEAARDISERALRRRVAAEGVGVEDLFGGGLLGLETLIGEAVAEAFDSESMSMTMFALGRVDLGRTGDVIQSTVRARLEQAREEAEAATRVARARVDAELGPYIGDVSDTALRYREVDVWHDLVYTNTARPVTVPGRPPAQRTEAVEVTVDAADEAVTADGEPAES